MRSCDEVMGIRYIIIGRRWEVEGGVPLHIDDDGIFDQVSRGPNSLGSGLRRRRDRYCISHYHKNGVHTSSALRSPTKAKGSMYDTYPLCPVMIVSAPGMKATRQFFYPRKSTSEYA